MSEAEKERRCERCRNFLSICGHNLPFKERMKSINVDKTSLKVGGNVKD